jgi:hypothetical protein
MVLEIGPSHIKSPIVLKIGPPPMDLRYGAGLMDFRCPDGFLSKFKIQDFS